MGLIEICLGSLSFQIADVRVDHEENLLDVSLLGFDDIFNITAMDGKF